MVRERREVVGEDAEDDAAAAELDGALEPLDGFQREAGFRAHG